MNKSVDRYDPCIGRSNNWDVPGGAEMEKSEDGLFVRFEDYVNLASSIQNNLVPYLMVRAPLEDGKITSDSDLIVVGHVHDFSHEFICGAYEGIAKAIQCYEDAFKPIPFHMKKMDSIEFKVTKIMWEESQQSHPETGQNDFDGYWDMNIELIDIGTPPLP
jgi:hypothetical protein